MQSKGNLLKERLMNNFLALQISDIGPFEYLAMIFLCLALILSLKETSLRLQRRSHWRKLSMIMANILAFLSLLGLVLQPLIQSDYIVQARLDTRQAALSKAKDPVEYTDYQLLTQSLETEQSQEKLPSDSSVKWIKQPQQILLSSPQLQRIEVLGDGLLASDWQAFGNIEVVYQEPKKLDGFVDIRWNKKVNLGDRLVVDGKIQSASKRVLTVQLIDPAGDKVAEQDVLAEEFFSLNVLPKLPGNHRYSLRLLDKQDILVEEKVHMQVTYQTNSKILVLQSSPSFETKYIQNWAAEHGAEMLIKTKISLNKYSTRRINMKKNAEDNLSFLFNQFDLLIIDGRGIIELSSVELEWLATSLKNGLGIIILADESLLESRAKWPDFLNGVELLKVANKNEVLPYWPDNNGVVSVNNEEFIPLAAASIRLSEQQLVHSKRLVESQRGELLVHQHSVEKGKVTLNLLQETYRWVTSGNKNIHSQFWQNLFYQTARTQSEKSLLIDENRALNFVKRQTQVCINTVQPIKQLKAYRINNEASMHTLLMQPVNIEGNRFCGYFWPEYSGWYQLFIDNSDELNRSPFDWIFVEPEDAWQAIQQKERIIATLDKQQAYDSSLSIKSEMPYKPINLWIFWWTFILCASFIWLERKFE